MRVPSIGLTLDERRIVREGYELAERMMRGYRDPPTLAETVGAWLTTSRQMIYRVFLRD